MRKNIFVACSLILSAIMLGGCSMKPSSEKLEAKSYPVKTMEVKNENFPVSLEYQGITGGSEVRKLSFKSPAKISKIYVSKGQQVRKGDKLVDLDKSDLTFAASAAEAQMAAASAQYEKAVNGAQSEDINRAQIAVKNAEDTYNYAKDNYDKNLKLYETGVVAKQQVDDIKLKVDSAESALNAAKQTLQQLQNGSRAEDIGALLAQVNAAKANYDSKINLLQDASMMADSDGYVVDVLCKEGEMLAAGYPAILIRSENQVVTVGLSQDDVKKVSVGTEAKVKLNDFEASGEIINIMQRADAQSGTYGAEIKLTKTIDNSKFYVGDSVKVSINMGEKQAMSIPINSILNDGEDYVYTVENGHAVRKNLTLGDTYDGKVSVEGLKVGDKLVIEGMKNIKAGYQVITE